MRFRTSLSRAARALAEGFLAPFLIATGGALALMRALDVQVPYVSTGLFPTAAAAAIAGGIVALALANRARPEAAALIRWSAVAVPALLAVLLAVAAMPEGLLRGSLGDAIDTLTPFATIVLLNLIVLRFWPSGAETVPAVDAARAIRAPRFGRRAFVGVAAGIIAIGIGLCAYEAVTTPTISVDEAHSANAASGILSRGLPYFPNTEVVYSRSWVNLYSIAASYSVFGFSEPAARLPSVIAYSLACLLFFLVARRIAPPSLALVGLALFALNPWIIHYGAYARMYIFLLLFSTLFVYLLLRFIDTRSRVVLFALLPLTLLLGVFSERTFLLFFPAYGLLVLLALPRTRAFWSRALAFGAVPMAIALAAAAYLWLPQLNAFVTRYVIGFNNGANPLANARLQFIPLDWLSFYGFPTVLLLAATALIILRGDLRARAVLALFWSAAVLVDVLIYSNFPARRFNYTFILVTLYAVVLLFGIAILLRRVPRWYGIGLAVFVAGVAAYGSLFVFRFPVYADFSTITLSPPGSLVLGYPTSPLIFYNTKFGHGADVRPFITDRIEQDKYEENGTEIYSGGAFVTGVSELNELRAGQDVYLYYEKTRLDFLNERTATYIFENCIPLTDAAAADIAVARQQNFTPSDDEYEIRGTMLTLRCPQLPE